MAVAGALALLCSAAGVCHGYGAGGGGAAAGALAAAAMEGGGGGGTAGVAAAALSALALPALHYAVFTGTHVLLHTGILALAYRWGLGGHVCETRVGGGGMQQRALRATVCACLRT